MINNVNFGNDLIINYLVLLAQNDEKEEFLKYYPSILPYMRKLLSDKSESEVTEKMKSIVFYANKVLEVGVTK